MKGQREINARHSRLCSTQVQPLRGRVGADEGKSLVEQRRNRIARLIIPRLGEEGGIT